MNQDQLETQQPKKCLTIGGWDPCGAFGMAADIKTFQALGCHGMGVMTVVTAQNSVGWYGAEFMSADFVAQQLDAVLGDYGADCVKTGFLGRLDLIETIVAKLIEYDVKNIVIDPVVINAKGVPMFSQEVLDGYIEKLFPLATAITPNLHELNLFLTGDPTPWVMADGALQAVFEFQERVGALGQSPAVIAKGIPQNDGRVADGLIENGAIRLLPHERVETQNLSGTGDSLSAALCARLGRGESLHDAFSHASAGVARAIAASAEWRLGGGPGPINHPSIY